MEKPKIAGDLPLQAWYAFVDLCERECVSLKNEEDWLPWFIFFKKGFETAVYIDTDPSH
jgi:hypothetical protein